MQSRKDSTPKQTIKTIIEILEKIGLTVNVKEVLKHENYWYSVRIEIEGLEGVGVNGKGVSEEYALASAYGELMERLQSGTLIDNLFSAFHDPEKNNYYQNFNEFQRGLEHISYKQDLTEQDISSRKIFKKALYINYMDQSQVELPEWFIDMDCMTTGLCAGNTFYEAVVQGMFEVFERNARRKMYEGLMRVTRLRESDLEDLESYKMLCEIRKNGYDWNIIDCTDGGLYPVLGVLIWDKMRENYLFTMGADLDLDICIQRCVTESFQGRKFDFLFYKHMTNIYDIYEERNLEFNSEYQRAVLSNSGKVPYQVLFCKESDGKWKSAFQREVSTNEDVFKILVNRLKIQNHKLYIRDMSSLGFPTYRVYIPGMSEVVNASQYYLKYDYELQKFNDNITNLTNCDSRKIKDLIQVVQLLESLPFNSSVSLLRRMKGIVLSENEYILDNHYLLFVLYSLANEPQNATSELINLGQNIYLRNKLFSIYIKNIAQLDSEVKENIHDQLLGKKNCDDNIYFANCPNCEECLLHTKCRINNWAYIMDKLESVKKNEICSENKCHK